MRFSIRFLASDEAGMASSAYRTNSRTVVFPVQKTARNRQALEAMIPSCLKMSCMEFPYQVDDYHSQSNSNGKSVFNES
jgi:hypothetical protein